MNVTKLQNLTTNPRTSEVVLNRLVLGSMLRRLASIKDQN